MRLQTLNAFISAHTKALLNGKAQPPKIQRTLKFLKKKFVFSSGNWKLKLQEEPRLGITHEKEKEKVAFGIYG